MGFLFGGGNDIKVSQASFRKIQSKLSTASGPYAEEEIRAYPGDVRNEVAQQELDLAFKIARRRQLIDNTNARVVKTAETLVDGSKEVGRNIGQNMDAVGVSTIRAMRMGQQRRPSFTREQAMLGEMFGHGEKIWGTNGQPVSIHNDLNSSKSDPWDETSSMFGQGPFGERSGLF